LQVCGLCFGYPQRALLVNGSYQIRPGLTLVRGGDGSGKTTLLRLLASDLSAQAGELVLGGVRLGDAPQRYLAQVAWFDPRSSAFDSITVTDFFGLVAQRFANFSEPALAELSEGFGLLAHQDKQLLMLSSGTRRKVFLAVALASGAALTLLDEPFAALDKSSISFLMEVLADAANHPTRAFVMAHHEAPGVIPLAACIDLDNNPEGL